MIKKSRVYHSFLALVIGITIFLSCKRKSESQMDNSFKNNFERISKTNIYFGHRSVGENIIQGITLLTHENKVNGLLINKLNENIKMPSNYFVDSNIGSNGDPHSKIDEFSRIVEKLSKENNLNIAMMKLCYADVSRLTNVDSVFRYYVNVIDSLKRKYPDLMIIHFTVPLTAKSSFYRKLIGIVKGTSQNNLLNNVARNKFNELLLSYFEKSDVFDLAAIESTFEDGTREEETYEGKPCYFLIKDYTSDGGHLNEVGERRVASKLIYFLAEKITSNTNNPIYK